MSTNTVIHVKHEGERWLLGVEETHYEHLNAVEVEFNASNHGAGGGDTPISESYKITSSEFIEMIRKHRADDMPKEADNDAS